MNKNVPKARYEIMTEGFIKSHKDEIVSLEDVKQCLASLNKSYENLGKLTGGRICGVYRFSCSNEDKVIKVSRGIYRRTELKREAKALRYLNNSEYKQFAPRLYDFNILNDCSYLTLDYIEGKSVREKLSLNNSIEERVEIWEKVGQVLARVHKAVHTENLEGKWLSEQLRIARINMISGLLDPEEFQEETPEERLKWLNLNKPNRKQISLIHGDFRTKNILIDKESNPVVIDWGFVDIGDPYYDLAIIDYYFKNELDRNSFYKGYGIDKYDKNLIEYFDKLSTFINV
ncbi:MAG: aminoglycoside phosphotransferase family protein [Firmicutes bacterium]|nr:aminoglycoside phosphotransferase family protein [Bacillota bacterium]